MFRQTNSKGQALVEFAIVAIVLFLIFFLIIEMGRILWGWVSVQSAARSGARYAITGQFDPECLYDSPPCEDPRVHSIEEVVESRLTGLNINQDPDAQYEDDFALFIEVYGVNSDGVLEEDFAGIPGQPMVVRVIYNVPILTPILSSIVTNVPVMGQVTVTNEMFGQVGAINEGQSVPPPVPVIPTAGPTETPTFTPSPTTTATPTDGPSPTPSSTSTPTPTNTPTVCSVRFEGALTENQVVIPITADIGASITLTDLTTGETLAGPIEVPGPFDGHFCEGFIQVSLPDGVNLIENHVILVESDDGSFDVAIVQPGVDTPTPLPSATPQPTNTPTPLAAATSTPIGPFIFAEPDCGFAPNVQFSVRGFNWDDNETVKLTWDGELMTTVPAGHGGSFTLNFQRNDAVDGMTHQIVASTATTSFTIGFEVPCPNVTATPTMSGPTATPLPADLVISEPTLISAPPIIGYQPVSFTVQISNTGEVDVNDLFFVDLFFDVPEEEVQPSGIPLDYSGAYHAVSNLAGGASKVITVTSDTGFTGSETDRTVHSMVDSVLQIEESNENNNVGGFIDVQITPGSTPVPPPTQEGSGEISGIVRTLYGSWVPQGRADVYLVLVEPNFGTDGRETLINQTRSALNTGFYQFLNVAPPPTGDDYYLVVACFNIDSEVRVGERPNVIPTDQFANVYMFPQATGCPTFR